MNDFLDNYEEQEEEEITPNVFSECIQDLYKGGDFDYEDLIDEENDSKEEIELYNQSLSYEENFEDGKRVKFLLLPLFKNQKDNELNFTPILNAGATIIMNRKQLAGAYSENFHYIIADYDSIFGLRLLSFQRYTNFFACDERVLFETLLIKFKRFDYKAFFLSIPTIYKELGIKETRANTIIKRFIELNILTKEVRTSYTNNSPSQVSFYFINANKVIELLPTIYYEFHLDNIQKDIETYLMPALK